MCARAHVHVRERGRERETQLVDILEQIQLLWDVTLCQLVNITQPNPKASIFATRMEKSNSAAFCYFVLQYCHLLSQCSELCSHNFFMLPHSKCLFLCMLSAVSDFLMADWMEQHISI
jgi:hypothetical protein